MRKSMVFIILIISIAAVWTAIGFQGYSRIVSKSFSVDPILIIDAGHGGFDGGAVTDDNIIEKDINLSISKKLADIARLGGFDVIMVREEDTAVCDDKIDGIRKKKISDIHNRLDIAENNPEALYISIHQNYFEQPQYHGTQVFYGPKNPESRKLAQIIQDTVSDSLQKDNKRETKKAEKNLYILYNTNSIAVMVECGFLSNKEECAKLCSEVYQQQLAFEIFRAIERYYNQTDHI